MSRWYAPPAKTELSPEAKHALRELRAATEACEQRYDVGSIDRLVRAAKVVNDAFGASPSDGKTQALPNPCKLTECRGKPRCEKCVKAGLNVPDGVPASPIPGDYERRIKELEPTLGKMRAMARADMEMDEARNAAASPSDGKTQEAPLQAKGKP